jgi:hypothetical protein
MTPALWIALIAMASIIGVIGFLRSNDSTEPDPSGIDAGAAGSGAVEGGEPGDRSGDGTTRAAGSGPIARATRIDVPRLSEVSLGEEVYTVLWASVTQRGPVKRLRLRIRFVNEGRYPANFWTQAFRLAFADRVIAPVDGPERVVQGNTIDHDAVTFDVPRNLDRATLRIVRSDESAAIPLDLTPIGYEEATDTADPGDVLSRASRTALPVPLPDTLLAGDVAITLTNAVMRRFVNRLRLVLGFRLDNSTEYSELVSESAFRLIAGDETFAPQDNAATELRPRGTRFINVMFAVPPGTSRVVLRVSHKDQMVDRTIELGLDQQRDRE